MDARLSPISPECFKATLLPRIESRSSWNGRLPRTRHEQVCSAMLSMLRPGMPWGDLPPGDGKWPPRAAPAQAADVDRRAGGFYDLQRPPAWWWPNRG
jgi:transposase